MIIVNGHNKARALYHAVEGAITQMWTISALQMHEKGIIVCDDAATAELKLVLIVISRISKQITSIRSHC